MQKKSNVSLEYSAYRLVIFVGLVYVAFGLFELINYFYQKAINLFQLFYYASIGIGLFERHSWSRTLCIISSLITVVLALILFIFGGHVLWNGSPITWGKGYIVVTIIIHSFLLYVLLRSDVKDLFSTKEN